VAVGARVRVGRGVSVMVGVLVTVGVGVGVHCVGQVGDGTGVAVAVDGKDGIGLSFGRAGVELDQRNTTATPPQIASMPIASRIITPFCFLLMVQLARVDCAAVVGTS
jgi:hypothetical protein